MKKALITGGAGFVGYHLSKHLLHQGYEVVIVDNLFRGKKDKDLEELLALSRVSFIEADLTDPNSCKTFGDGYDYVYHLASVNGTKLFYEIPHEVLRIGIKTTLNIIDWFVNVNKKGKIIYTSSNEAYAGALDSFGKLPLPTPEDVPLIVSDPYNPRWSYGAQKLIGEMLFIHNAKAFNFRMSIVRPHNFYGPRAGYGHVIPQMIERIQKHEDPFIVYGSDATRTFCFIDDAVEAMRLVAENEITDFNTYHIGRSIEDEINMENLAKKLFEVANWHPNKIEPKPDLEGSVKRRAPDVTKIKQHTGWDAATDLSVGLKNTFDWYVKNPKS